MGGGRWSVGGGRWIGRGRWAVGRGRWAAGGGRWAVGGVGGGWVVGEEAAHRTMSGARKAWRAAAEPLAGSLGRVPRVGSAVCGRSWARSFIDFWTSRRMDSYSK